MRFLKLSLAACVALGALSTSSLAQPLEEAIKGVDVSGYLRYRYNDDRYDDGTATSPGNKGSATHRWKAVADFKTPVVNNVALNLGILYNNENQNVNHGKGLTTTTTDATTGVSTTTVSNNFLGQGLGSGKDSSFGVSTFFATIAPDSTATTVLIGKQRLGTPLTMAGDDDRGTGILALNSDIPGLTLAAGAFDSWALDDLTKGYNSGNPDGLGVDLPLYVLAGIYGLDTGAGNLGIQLWGFSVQDLVDTAIFFEGSWQGALLNAKLQYLFATIGDGESDKAAGLVSDNDLLSFQIGANFANTFNVPLDITLGYMGNFQDGTYVSFDDEGAIAKAGKLWWQNPATGITFGIGQAVGAALGLNPANYIVGQGTTQEISVMYATLGYGFLENRLRIGIEGVFGSNERTQEIGGATILKTDFTEITPTISWKHNSNLTISAFYAMLSTDIERAGTINNRPVTITDPSEDRNRMRVEVRYNF